MVKLSTISKTDLLKFGKKFSLSLITTLLLSGCVSTKKTISRTTTKKLASEVFKNHYAGFIVYNPESKEVVYEHNSQKYFTPASNTKIFTLYASLKLLPKFSPALKYSYKNDSTYIQGTGNPTLLHSYFKDTSTINFLKGQRNIVLHLSNFTSDRFGAGWAWEDYDSYYSPELSGFPLYGNVLTAFQTDSLVLYPNYFRENISYKPNAFKRDIVSNTFYLNPVLKDTIEIPFKIGQPLIKELLEKELGKNITISKVMPAEETKILYSVATDSIAQRMMYESDNFLAEQLLLLSSSTLSDTLNTKKVIQHVLDSILTDLKQKPRWVDGSGLSRYNLFTPESFVQVLDKLYTEIPKERLLSLFPAGGVSGTLKNWYKGKAAPYIFAKSGSLGNNYCLSGYLITNSGKTLIFSFMNNHFMHSSSAIKLEMQQLLEMIRDTY